MPEFKQIPNTDLTFTREPPNEPSWFQDTVHVPFSRLVEVFGEPDTGDDYKVAFHWELGICRPLSRPVYVAIYDWKETSLYDEELPSPADLRASDFADWHIGGNNSEAVQLVLLALGLVW